ncbi:hypothetical protein [Chelatococcus asaccharovorans]|uniref:hypothetical protein n=1 Tax=Chelatococcus asaccharovorans TaxID=28210 RepID=UPI00224C68C4|nr:hypothetical protein [Chelatococcus asaccharovorans]CAH1665959.1 conserved exported hypothetical protein [Chelatococcus asaccharovorans]CAH1681699.1 conserved exported hypothetical protein [Chelatococcus asaccharovorans]
MNFASHSMTRTILTGWSAACVGVLFASLAAQGASAAGASSIAFNNMPDSNKSFKIDQSERTPIASVEIDVSAPSNVLVQFSAEAEAGETDDGCPCSIRAFLQADDEKPLPVKRINVGAPAVTEVSKYEHDRQEITGSLVFPVPAGKHKFTFIAQQVTGKSKQLKIDYPNLQAIAFPQNP